MSNKYMRSLIANKIKNTRDKENAGKKNEDYFSHLRNNVSRPPLQKNENILNKSTSDVRKSYSQIPRKQNLISTTTDLSSKRNVNVDDNYSLKRMVRQVYEKRNNCQKNDSESELEKTSRYESRNKKPSKIYLFNQSKQNIFYDYSKDNVPEKIEEFTSPNFNQNFMKRKSIYPVEKLQFSSSSERKKISENSSFSPPSFMKRNRHSKSCLDENMIEMETSKSFLNDKSNENKLEPYFYRNSLRDKINEHNERLTKEDIVEKYRNRSMNTKYEPSLDRSKIEKLDMSKIINHSKSRISYEDDSYKNNYSKMNSRRTVDMTVDEECSKIEESRISHHNHKKKMEIHGKDLEIMELRNKIKLIEVELKENGHSLKELNTFLKDKDNHIEKLNEDVNLKNKEIEYLKKFKNKLEGDIKDFKTLDEKKQTHIIALAEKSHEINELKDKNKILKAEYKIMIASEKEAWEKEMRAKDKIIEKKNSIIGELEKGKIDNLPILNNYSKLCEKIRELENMQENVLHENSLLKQELSKVKTDMAENELLKKELILFFELTSDKMNEIKELSRSFFEIARRLIKNEDINLDLLFNFRKMDTSNNPMKKQELIKNIFNYKEIIVYLSEQFKLHHDSIYDLYAKKCGDECNIQ